MKARNAIRGKSVLEEVLNTSTEHRLSYAQRLLKQTLKNDVPVINKQSDSDKAKDALTVKTIKSII